VVGAKVDTNKDATGAKTVDGAPTDSVPAEFKDLVQAKDTEVMRDLNFLYQVNEFKSVLENLFNPQSNPINIKKTNETITSQGLDMMQLGGGWFSSNKKADTALESNTKGDALDKVDAQEFSKTVTTVFNEDKEFADMLINFNKKFKDVVENSKEAYASDKVNVKDLSTAISKTNDFFENKATMTPDEEKAIKDIKNTLRPILSNFLKDQKFDPKQVIDKVKKAGEEGKPVSNVTTEEKVESKTEVTPESAIASQEKELAKISEGKAQEQSQQAFQSPQGQTAPTSVTATSSSLLSKIPGVGKVSDLFTSVTGTKGAAPQVVSVDGRSLPNLKSTHEYIQHTLEELDVFSKKIQRKQARWVDELNIMMSSGEFNLKAQIQSKAAQVSSGKVLEMERRRISAEMLYLMKKAMRPIGEKADVNFAYFKEFFYQEKRKDILAIISYIKNYSYLTDPTYIASFKENASSAQQLADAYKAIEQGFNTFIGSLDAMNQKFYETLSNLTEDAATDNTALAMTDKDRSQILKRKQALLDKLEALPNKLKSFYTLNISVTEMFDTQFVIMYVIKALRLLSFRYSMNMATNVFLQKYESTVYDKKQNPPSLFGFMAIFLGFDLFFNAFLFVVLGLCGFLFKTENNTFPIDKFLFYKYGFDYATTLIIILLIGYLIGNVIKQKKYFRYKTEGERGIRAFEEIMKMTATIVTLLPMFLIIA
jgi:hypothetical protein